MSVYIPMRRKNCLLMSDIRDLLLMVVNLFHTPHVLICAVSVRDVYRRLVAFIDTARVEDGTSGGCGFGRGGKRFPAEASTVDADDVEFFLLEEQVDGGKRQERYFFRVEI